MTKMRTAEVFKSVLLALVSQNIAATAALAHAPFPPPVRAYHVLKSLPFKSFVSPKRIGLSGSTRGVLAQRNTIAQTGFNNGLNTSLTKALQGQITSGQLTGSFSQAFTTSGGSTIAFNNYVLEFNQNGGSIPATASSVINNLNFAPAGHTSSVGKLAFPLSGPRHPAITLSGSEMALQKQLRGVAESSTAAGAKFGNQITSSPIVAGEFYGADYSLLGSGPPFHYGGAYTFAYGFGSDPLNFSSSGNPVTLYNLNPAILRNYIQLANGTVINYSSGLLSVYAGISGIPATGFNRLLSIGKDPYNFYGSSLPSTSFSATFANFPLSYLLK